MKNQKCLVVGDLHGEHVALELLLQDVAKSISLSSIKIILQDLTDKGLDTCSTLNYVLSLKKSLDVELLTSNHDFDFANKKYHNLKEGNSGLFDYDNCEVPITHYELLKSSKRVFELESAIIVHAGIPPGVTDLMTLETEDCFRKSRADHYIGNKWVIMGHRVRPQIEIDRNQVFIDTGACLFNYHRLSAVLVSSDSTLALQCFSVLNPIKSTDLIYLNSLDRKKRNKKWFYKMLNNNIND